MATQAILLRRFPLDKVPAPIPSRYHLLHDKASTLLSSHLAELASLTTRESYRILSQQDRIHRTPGDSTLRNPPRLVRASSSLTKVPTRMIMAHQQRSGITPMRPRRLLSTKEAQRAEPSTEVL